MSEALDHVRQVCAEFDLAHPHWQEEWESDKACAFERQQREIAEERERREAGKMRQAAATQQVMATNWVATIDERIHEHLKSWLWKAIDARITQWWNDNAIDERI